MYPTLFVSHGAPDRLLNDTPAGRFLDQLGVDWPLPKAVLVLSAHWLSASAQYTGPGPLQTLHDFSGFPEALYQLHYPARGAPWLCEALAGCLEAAGKPAREVSRGLDHGAWAPLSQLYPRADIPVIALSLPATGEIQGYVQLGRSLGPLRGQGVLILGSGSATHNLGALSRQPQPPPWARAFTAWLHEQVLAGDLEALADYRQQAPQAALAHPTDEHYVPLLVAAGAAAGEPARLLHDSWEYGSLNNSCFAFGEDLPGTANLH